MKKYGYIWAIVAATVWISASEFIRNQLVFNGVWVEHYNNLGLTFPVMPINGILWGLWSLIFAVILYIIQTKFGLIKTTIIGWMFGFVLMWVVIGNLGVLPIKLLFFAIPLSVLEVFIATWIIVTITKRTSDS